MNFLSPMTALIAAGITVPLLVSLYFLKLRRRRVTISSTLLWKKAIQDMQVNAPFQRLRRNLLLLLQLLVLAALLLALGRPTLRGMAQPGDRMVILIDHSASMNAADISPTRLDESKKRALELIDSLGSDGQSDAVGGAMVISFAARAKVAQPFTTDRALLRRAVESIRPTDQPGRLSTALELIEPIAQGGGVAAGSGSVVVYVISDGQAHDSKPAALAGVELRYLKIGRDSDNLAIVSLAARRDLKDPFRVRVFSRLANYGQQKIETNLTLKIDGRTQRVSPVAVPGRVDGQPGAHSVQFELSLPASALLELAFDHEDHLAADNTAWLAMAPPKRLRVLLVSKGNAFLEQAIKAAAVRKLVLMTPKRYEDQDPARLKRASGDAGFDVIVFDSYAPEYVPVVNSVYFSAAPPIDGLKLFAARQGSANTQVILDWRRDHPLLRHVALDDLLVVEPGRLALPDGARMLATGPSGPAMAVMTTDGIRHVVVGFDLIKSNWPMQIGFPVFTSNTVHWLGSGDRWNGGANFQPGQAAAVRLDDSSDTLRYEGPVPLRIDASQGASFGGQVVLPVFEKVGVYTAQNGVVEPWDRLAVSLLDMHESDLAPASKLDVGTSPVNADQSSAMIRREVWPWFLATALVCLMVEWVVYTRRMSL